MNELMLVVLVLTVAGSAMVLFALVTLTVDKRKEDETEVISVAEVYQPALDRLENVMHRANNDVNTITEEIDKAMEELNQTSTAIFDELENKYQELLFLYALIDEKKNEIADIYRAPETPASLLESKTKTFENPHLADIVKLESEGFSVSEIAKRLNIGQGEVKLILEFNKVIRFR